MLKLAEMVDIVYISRKIKRRRCGGVHKANPDTQFGYSIKAASKTQIP